MKQKLIRILPYVFFALLFTKLPQAWRYAGGTNFGETFLNINEGLSVAFSNPFPSFYGGDFLFGIMASAILWLMVYVKQKNAKKFRHGIEYGSARWGTSKDIKPFIDPDFFNNVIFTATEFLTMEKYLGHVSFGRNKNVFIVGGSGTGKTRFWLIPNLMQALCSYVITDPKGGIVLNCGKCSYRILKSYKSITSGPSDRI